MIVTLAIVALAVAALHAGSGTAAWLLLCAAAGWACLRTLAMLMELADWWRRGR